MRMNKMIEARRKNRTVSTCQTLRKANSEDVRSDIAPCSPPHPAVQGFMYDQFWQFSV
jgi:hypothetical protein